MKNLSKVLALVLVVAMVFSFAVSASAKTSFKDDASIKYEEAVELLSALKVINGYTDGTFKPTGNITRGEFAVMVSYMVANDWSEIPLYSDIKQLGKDYAPYCTFADTKNHWSAGYVAYCAGNGYISGRSADVFDPDATITAAEISVILLRVMGYDATIENFGTTSGTTKGYATQLTARNAGLLNGLDTMNFWAAATREQAAQLMFNALKGNVVTYGNTAFTLDWTTGRVIVSNLNNAKAVQSTATLMHYCFNRVACIEATDINGQTGHQWIAYKAAVNANENLNIIAAKLTDVYADDTVMATFVGGTPYSKIATALGVTSKNTVKSATVFVNGYEVDGTKKPTIDLPDTLLDLYMQGVDGAKLPDNCRLVVVKNPDRAQVGTTYKLLYYYELVGVLDSVKKITAPKDPHYGDFMYTFVYWYDYPYATTNVQTGYFFSASDKVYSQDVYYLVEPNDSQRLQPSANIDVVEDYQDFLSIKVAKTEGPVMFKSGSYQNFADNVTRGRGNGYASDGTKNYAISKYAHDFVNVADYNKNMYLIYNTAGYVQGFLPAKAASNVDSIGYVYIDSLEFEVTATASSSLIRKADGTLSAQAKALAYFPTEAGNNVPSVIDLAIDNRSWYVAAVKANNGYENPEYNLDTFVDSKVDAAGNVIGIALPRDTTNAFHDDPRRNYAHYQAGNIRVYDLTYDGWYYFEKYKDGTYAIVPVGTDEVTSGTLANGAKDANVDIYGDLIAQGADLSGLKYVLTSSTDDNMYNMDLGTMTAKVTTVTGYKNMDSRVHGGFAPTKDPVNLETYVPYIGRVGGDIFVNDRNTTIVEINEFDITTPANALRFALYKGESGWFAGEGQYRLKFLGAGVGNYLFAAPQVRYYAVGDTTGTVIKGTELRSKLIKAEAYDKDGKPNQNNEVYALTLDEDNYIVAVKAYPLYAGIASGVDVDGYVRIDGIAYNFNTKQAWNFTSGKAETVANGDTIFYFDDPTTSSTDISVLWLLHANGGYVSDPRWTDVGTRPAPWDWWIR